MPKLEQVHLPGGLHEKLMYRVRWESGRAWGKPETKKGVSKTPTASLVLAVLFNYLTLKPPNTQPQPILLPDLKSPGQFPLQQPEPGVPVH